MRKALFLLLLICISGCKSDPTAEEIYENKLTRERIKIDRVGMGSELRDFYDRINEIMEEVLEDPASRIHLLRFPVISNEDTLKQCISYEENSVLSAGSGKVWLFKGEKYDNVPVTYARIISVEKLKKDFVKVE